MSKLVYSSGQRVHPIVVDSLLLQSKNFSKQKAQAELQEYLNSSGSRGRGGRGRGARGGRGNYSGGPPTGPPRGPPTGPPGGKILEN